MNALDISIGAGRKRSREPRMPGPKPSTLSEISDIQRRMALIRRDMHQEVQGAVKGAQLLMDWQSWVKTHPWTLLGVALVVGYVIVPRPRRTTPSLAPLAEQRAEVVAADLAQADTSQPPAPRRRSWAPFSICWHRWRREPLKTMRSTILSNGCRNDHSRRPPRQGGLPRQTVRAANPAPLRPLTGFENMADFVTNRPAAARVTAFAVGVL